MTIKQQGGVFGRNPSFNTVEASQEITVEAPGSLKVMANGNAWSLPTDRSFSISTGYGAAYLRSINHNGFHGPIYHNGNQHIFLFADTEKARFNTSGNLAFVNGAGIDFSATSGTGTSELFDDYEEGTWTPALAGLTTAGVGTYTRQLGWYTKVGNVCHLTFSLVWTAHTGTGTMFIGGLPFNGAYYALNVQQAGTVVDQNITLTAGNNLACSIGNSGSTVLLYNQPSGGGANGAISVQSTGTISGQISYRTA